MKKVLASVLAGSMVLGMAAAASAATSLTLKQGSGDYDYQLWLYEPAGVYDKAGEVEYSMTTAVEKAYKTFVGEYKKFAKLSDIDSLKAYDTASGANNVFATYTAFYNAAAAAKSPINAAPATIAADLGLLAPNAANACTTGPIKFDALDAAGDLTTSITSLTLLNEATTCFETLTTGTTYMTPAAIESYMSTKAVTDKGVGSGEYQYQNKASIDIADALGHYMYTYGEDDAKEVTFEVIVKHGDDFRVDVADGNATVSRKRVEADTENDIDRYKVTIKAAAGVRDFELADFKVEMDCEDANAVYYIEGEVAYSDYREVLPDERYIINKSDTNNLHDDGCIFDFSEVIDEETRIVCNDYVDLIFKGNYGTDFENLRVMTDDITEVEDFFQDYDIDYYDFIGTPKFAKDITVRIDADSDAYIYEYDKSTGDVVDITDECEYTSDGMTFKRKTLKTYVVLEEPYEGGNVKAEKEPIVEEEPEDEPEETEEPKDDTSNEGSKPNPGTGAYPLF